MIYEILLLIGVVGLVAQTVLGFAHVGGSGHHAASGRAPGGGAGTHGHGSAHGQSHTNSQNQQGQRTNAIDATGLLLTLLSPMTIFSVCLGAGAAGLVMQSLKETPTVVIVGAALGGIVFYGGIVRPMAGLVFRFASKPAKTLAGAIATEAVATSRFDSQGRGVVRLTVDGQSVRILANLESDDREQSATIAPGDSLLVTNIDKKKNTCSVTRL